MRFRSVITAVAIATLSPLAACSGGSEDSAASEKHGSQSLAQAMKADKSLSIFTSALNSTNLSTVFNGPAEYTLLAPTDEAFGKLGKNKPEVTNPEQKAALTAMLRDHILPGAIKPEDIEKALAAGNGKAISMATMGAGTISFSEEGNKIVATSSDGQQASLGSPVQASNGIVIPVDTVLRQWGPADQLPQASSSTSQ